MDDVDYFRYKHTVDGKAPLTMRLSSALGKVADFIQLGVEPIYM